LTSIVSMAAMVRSYHTRATALLARAARVGERRRTRESIAMEW
jgi:hypothetical protein